MSTKSRSSGIKKKISYYMNGFLASLCCLNVCVFELGLRNVMMRLGDGREQL